jgi:hypothetical protein
MSEADQPGSECNGLCVIASDVGIPGYGDQIAYSHPMCPEHGHPHKFRWSGRRHDTHDGTLRVCECGAYEDEH